jgi:hypothetical protein
MFMSCLTKQMEMSLKYLKGPLMVIASAVLSIFLLNYTASNGIASESAIAGQELDTAKIEILPPNPTTADPISIRISGVWRNGCIPMNPQVTRAGNEIQINTSNPSQVCTAALTPWSYKLGIGNLAAGAYQVTVIHNGRNELGSKSFNVLP